MPHSAENVRELKFGKNFDLIDADHDGITTLEDWREFAYYLCSQFSEPIDSLTGNQVQDAVLSWWYEVLGRVDADDRQLTRAEFIAHYNAGKGENLGAIIHEYVDAVFALCDADGRLYRREFARVLRVHGVPEHDLPKTMQHMIADQTTVSKEKYTSLMIDFWLSADAQSPGSWLLGKL